ncbi:catechol 2,3-dioxygenase-like lactoylglutathione lyase family enzyme [Bacillus mesophilus]|uniref:VOC family protein n=1 Tax=Bacillus mesophilus TaxID=1808955 RepID=A0A6M0Q3E7_9BACI|nr:VOC family protein [Bacillus mesophilus]MBM7659824.1 catechol 2,3-dioxygenase-like lactoylglutathione lyase family enzyme [Bacillus mesophilus]NEY70683.1 VOC family protein [Bacillus mesophilus]
MCLVDRIDTICLKVSNIDKASLWYQEKLGLKIAYRGEHYQVLSIGDSGIPLTIEEGKGEISKNGQSYPIFFSKNITETFQTLKELGVMCKEIQIDVVNTYFDFYDLDGNQLQVCFWK